MFTLSGGQAETHFVSQQTAAARKDNALSHHFH